MTIAFYGEHDTTAVAYAKRTVTMSYYSWVVQDGVLGTAIVTGGTTEDFIPASLRSYRSPKAPNLVDLVCSEADFTPLGRLLIKLIGGESLSSLYVEATASKNSLLPPGTSTRLQFAPQCDFRVNRYPAQEYFPVGRLAVLSAWLKGKDFLRDFLPELTEGNRQSLEFLPVALTDLPLELECVVGYNLRYHYRGQSFTGETVPRLIGLHEHTVVEIEHQLSPSADRFVHALVKRNKRCWHERRFGWELRLELDRLFEGVRATFENPEKRQQLLDWLKQGGRDESAPGRFGAQLWALCQLYACRQHISTYGDYAQLKQDILEKVHALAAPYTAEQ